MHRTMISAGVMLCVAILPLGSGSSAGAAADGLIENASFEFSADGKPTAWTTTTWAGDASFTQEESGHTGRCVAVASETGADAAWTITVPVVAWTQYRLTGWIKTENVTPSTGKGALINLHNLPVQSREIMGTSDWIPVSLEFRTDEQEEIQINCLFGGWGQATGKAWYDDLALEVVKKARVKLSARIDAAKMGAPISKYIYGQFIEHLGRCIYGGIWAEMLEDRKFYHAVGAEGSPWKAFGTATLTMESEGAYAGEHMPHLALASGEGGIVQEQLALVQGKAYTGRIVLRGTSALDAVAVSLSWGKAPQARQTITLGNFNGEWRTYPLSFEAGDSTGDGFLEIAARGVGAVDIGPVSLMPADNVHGLRADTLAVLKELDAPVYRWPGGNFVSGYNWKDGIGDPDKRPPRKNPAWQGVEHNDFGMDEFMAFCAELATEPYLVVNSGQGDVQLAVEELQYANGPADSPMGQMRAQNGHPEPYGVKWWGIGNEMYGDWQLGHMPLEEYVKKHIAFAEAMRQQDPGIQIIGVGATGVWSETMLTQCAGHMDLLSEHFYCGGHRRLQTHVRQIPAAIRHKVKAHREYHDTLPSLKGKKIPICMDEWNYWYGEHLYGELGTRYFLRDALGIAAGLHEYFRSSDMVFMANYAQTVNVIGCIKTNKTAAALETTGLVLKLYRQHFGMFPINVQTGMGPVDITAAWNKEQNAITIGVVNPTPEALAIPLEVRNAALRDEGSRWTITGANDMAYNEPGKEPGVVIAEEQVDRSSGKLEVPPISVCVFEFAVR